MTTSKAKDNAARDPSAARTTSPHARFIPREELGGFAAWTPESLGMPAPGAQGGRDARAANPGDRRAPPPAPAGPTADEWQARVLEARQSGYQDGYRDGLAALDAAKRQHLAQTSAQMAQVIAAFDEQTQLLDAQCAAAVTATAVQLARQIVRAELTERPELVAQVAQQAIGAVMRSARHLQVRVHPQDHTLVADGAAEALAGRAVRLIADPAVSRGGCIVESDLGSVDARIESRWAQASAIFGCGEGWQQGAPAAEAAAGDATPPAAAGEGEAA